MSTFSSPAVIPAQVFAGRRSAICEALEGGVMVLPAAPVRFRSRDTEYRYRPDSELYYACGAIEPGTVAVISGGAEPSFVLFVRERDPDAELWAGPRLGPEAAGELFGADAAFPIGDLARRLPALLHAGDRVHYRLGREGELPRLVQAALEEARVRGHRKGSGPRAVVDPGEILDPLRLHKDEFELERVRQACAVTVAGQRAGIAAVAPGVGEWVIEAEVEAEFRRAGAAGSGFETIAASGPNGCVLHYVDNSRIVRDGDLVLVDAGAEFGLYNGDVTRTVPASGSFTPEQRAVYEVVEAARVSAIAAVKPDVPVSDVHEAAVSTIVDGLLGLGLLTQDVQDARSPSVYREFFPHQTTHWLGLDVHDPGDYARAGSPRALQPGMVLTVEPGVYLRVGSKVPAAFQGMGIRIEDDIVVTEDGHENLTGSLPTSIEDVEHLVSEGG
jgi:Xaa-Pro aminopeptidase